MPCVNPLKIYYTSIFCVLEYAIYNNLFKNLDIAS
jgi:hypothetical protein